MKRALYLVSHFKEKMQIIYFIVGDFFHHTQSFYGLQSSGIGDKVMANYATFALAGGIQQMQKQRQMQNTLHQTLLTNHDFVYPVNIISSD